MKNWLKLASVYPLISGITVVIVLIFLLSLGYLGNETLGGFFFFGGLHVTLIFFLPIVIVISVILGAIVGVIKDSKQ